MSPAARDRRKVAIPIWIATAAAWTLLIWRDGGLAGSCCIPTSLQDGFTPTSWQMLMNRNPIGLLALGWALMLVAMMGPLVAHPIRHTMERSFARRRARSVLLFLLGYVGIWALAGAIILPIALTIRLFAPTSWAPVVVASALCILWEFSPLKQKCLNRGNAHPHLASFGAHADFDAARFGAVHAFWCVGSCGPLMFATELFPVGHLAAMGAVTVWLIGEKLNRPAVPRWRLRGIGKALKLVSAQLKLAPQTLRASL